MARALTTERIGIACLGTKSCATATAPKPLEQKYNMNSFIFLFWGTLGAVVVVVVQFWVLTVSPSHHPPRKAFNNFGFWQRLPNRCRSNLAGPSCSCRSQCQSCSNAPEPSTAIHVLRRDTDTGSKVGSLQWKRASSHFPLLHVCLYAYAPSAKSDCPAFASSNALARRRRPSAMGPDSGIPSSASPPSATRTSPATCRRRPHGAPSLRGM
eukprot:607001-Amphidinium_carterae.1